MARTPNPPSAEDGLDDAQLQQLQIELDRVPAPLQPLDISALDGYLCGVLLQPDDKSPAQWLPLVNDIEARSLPAGFDASPLHTLVRRRHAQLQQAIGTRQWFDPWVFELETDASPSECLLPWVAGFAAAMERFPALMQMHDPRLLEPLASIYMHFDADDLEDAQSLLAEIATLEPPADLAEGVQDIVRSVMLLADVGRPLAQAPRTASRRRRGAP
jgi:uncharacterized protein